jgi:hypothetical protein
MNVMCLGLVALTIAKSSHKENNWKHRLEGKLQQAFFTRIYIHMERRAQAKAHSFKWPMIFWQHTRDPHGSTKMPSTKLRPHTTTLLFTPLRRSFSQSKVTMTNVYPKPSLVDILESEHPPSWWWSATPLVKGGREPLLKFACSGGHTYPIHLNGG